jgi:hypothetical protein
LNAKPLQAVNDWLQDYRALWGESMRSLKTYIEAGTPSSRGNADSADI